MLWLFTLAVSLVLSYVMGSVYRVIAAAQLAAAVKAGDTVTVKGYPEAPTQIRGYVTTNTAAPSTPLHSGSRANRRNRSISAEQSSPAMTESL